MKIIKSGKLKKPMRIKCKLCKCVFITEENYLTLNDTLGIAMYYAVKCPECTKEMTVIR